MTVSDILAVLEAFAPARWAEQVYSGDNVGLLAGRHDAEVTCVMAALDVTDSVIEEAKKKGAQLIVTHHPVTFGQRSITSVSHSGRILLSLIENRMAAICMHTNWDAAPGGINDLLARTVGLVGTLDILGSAFTDHDGRRYGLGRVGHLPNPLSAQTLAGAVKTALGCCGVRFVDGGRPCHFVAVGSGSSGSQWPDVLRHGCDTFITGDVKYHLFVEAMQAGVTLIDAGHFPTEHIIVAPVAAMLRDKLPGLMVLESTVEEEPAIWL